jgi:hypothetical protein
VVAFRVTAVAQAPAGRTWALLTDWTAHARWVPLTAVRVGQTGTGTGVGGGFEAVTRLGPLRLVDRMRITEWSPPSTSPPRPGRVELVKLGPHLHGGAAIEVWPLPGGRTRIDWHEEVRPAYEPLARLARWADVVTRPVSRRIFAGVLHRVVTDLEKTTGDDA